MIGGYHTPGVYTEELAPTEAAILRTGRPAFLGYAPAGPLNQPAPIRDYAQFAATFGPAGAGGYLAAAVRGFFENGGTVCYAVRLDDSAEADPSRALTALRAGLAAIEPLGDIDLVCV